MDAEPGVMRVTVTLDPIDVELLDRLARLEGANRSAELRTLLRALRPQLLATVTAFEHAEQMRGQLNRAAAEATLTELAAIQPEVEDISRRFLGAIAKLEGTAAAADEAPGSNTGATE